MCEFSAYVAFDKATHGQTDIKHEMGETLNSSMSLLKIVGENLPPLQRSSFLDMTIAVDWALKTNDLSILSKATCAENSRI